MNPIKISLIGAGSASFSLGLIKDLCNTPALAGARVSFMDINPSRLATCHKLCSRYGAEVGSRLALEAATDRRESLRGADFVVNTALPGAHYRMVEGMEIARRHGYRFNGSYHIMYDEAFWINYEQLRFFDSLTEDMLELCPNAWHLMVANPVFAGTTHVLRKYPGARMIGICHGYGGVYSVAKTLGLEKGKFTFQIPGVNHFVFLTDFYYEGQDAFPILDRWISEKSGDFWASKEYPGGHALSPKAVDIYRTFGVLPIGDTSHWTGACWPWWYHSDEQTQKDWGEVDAWRFWSQFQVNSDHHAENLRRDADDLSIKVSQKYTGSSGESFIGLIEAMACDKPKVFQGNNILNTGQFVPGIPENVAVEVPTLVSRRGVQGIRTGDLPRGILAHVFADRIGPMEMELAAYNQGSRDLLLQLILMDRNTHSKKQAEAFLDEILALPYHQDMREHYR